MLVLINKPSQMRQLQPLLASRFPGQKLVYLVVNAFGFPLEFDFPDESRVLPDIRTPAYRFNADKVVLLEVAQGRPRQCGVDLADLHEDGLLAVTDSSVSEVHSVIQVRDILAARGIFGVWHGLSTVVGLDDESVERALQSTLSDDRVSELVRMSHVKRTFNFNFLLNSRRILTARYLALGGQLKSLCLSKYMVQLLFLLRRQPLTEHNVLHTLMARWKGTGQFGLKAVEMGSAASRGAIFDTLVQSGLAANYLLDGKAHPDGSLMGLTPLGHAFLATLPAGAEDTDLPFRLQSWQTLPEPGLALVQDYLRSWFGRLLQGPSGAAKSAA